MDFIIYILVGVIALAVIAETLKRSKASKVAPSKAPLSNDEDTGPYVSADEAEPTQTGRMRAMPIKKAIQGEENNSSATPGKAGLKQPLPPKNNPKKGAHNSINHETIESTDSGSFDLPDPFSIELSEDTKE